MSFRVHSHGVHMMQLVFWLLASTAWIGAADCSAVEDPPPAQGSRADAPHPSALAASPERSGEAQTPPPSMPAPLFLIPNFHDACMGWLVSYAEERNFGLYSYLAHLDRAAADERYKFLMSEIPHLITMMEFEPQRVEELKKRIAEGRVELVNAFVLEPTVNLSGGEALVQQGVQGLAWYQEVLGLRPRAAWMIDVCGWHEQMAQITQGLGLDAFVYCRYNPTGGEPEGEPTLTNWDEVKSGSALHWITSPDGSKVLALSPGLYCDVDFQPLFRSEQALGDDELRQLVALAEANRQRFPADVPPADFGRRVGLFPAVSLRRLSGRVDPGVEPSGPAHAAARGHVGRIPGRRAPARPRAPVICPPPLPPANTVGRPFGSTLPK